MIHILLLAGVLILNSLLAASLHLFPVMGIILAIGIVALSLVIAMFDYTDVSIKDLFSYITLLSIIPVILIALPISSPQIALLVGSICLFIGSELSYKFSNFSEHLYEYSHGLLIASMIPLGGIVGYILSFLASEISTIQTEIFPLALIIILIASIAHSLFFHGLLQNTLANLFSKPVSIIFVICMSYIYYIPTRSIESIIFIFLSGLMSMFYAKTKNLYAVIVFNLTLSLTFFLLRNTLLIIFC